MKYMDKKKLADYLLKEEVGVVYNPIMDEVDVNWHQLDQFLDATMEYDGDDKEAFEGASRSEVWNYLYYMYENYIN